MKCQKNKTCKKQPMNSHIWSDNTKWCTGCDKKRKDRNDKPKR